MVTNASLMNKKAIESIYVQQCNVCMYGHYYNVGIWMNNVIDVHENYGPEI